MKNFTLQQLSRDRFDIDNIMKHSIEGLDLAFFIDLDAQFAMVPIKWVCDLLILKLTEAHINLNLGYTRD